MRSGVATPVGVGVGLPLYKISGRNGYTFVMKEFLMHWLRYYNPKGWGRDGASWDRYIFSLIVVLPFFLFLSFLGLLAVLVALAAVMQIPLWLFDADCVLGCQNSLTGIEYKPTLPTHYLIKD